MAPPREAAAAALDLRAGAVRAARAAGLGDAHAAAVAQLLAGARVLAGAAQRLPLGSVFAEAAEAVLQHSVHRHGRGGTRGGASARHTRLGRVLPGACATRHGRRTPLWRGRRPRLSERHMRHAARPARRPPFTGGAVVPAACAQRSLAAFIASYCRHHKLHAAAAAPRCARKRGGTPGSVRQSRGLAPRAAAERPRLRRVAGVCARRCGLEP